MDTIVIHGPRACGKTRHKLALAAKYGVAEDRIIDDPALHQRIPAEGALVLTCAPMKNFINIPFERAMIGVERIDNNQTGV